MGEKVIIAGKRNTFLRVVHTNKKVLRLENDNLVFSNRN